MSGTAMQEGVIPMHGMRRAFLPEDSGGLFHTQRHVLVQGAKCKRGSCARCGEGPFC